MDVVDYTDHASAVMPEDEPPLRVTAITLRPRITVTGAPPRAKVERLVEVAHRECFIARSLTSQITLEPTILGCAD